MRCWIGCLKMGGGFNGSAQHFSLIEKMECRSWPIAADNFSQLNNNQRYGTDGDGVLKGFIGRFPMIIFLHAAMVSLNTVTIPGDPGPLAKRWQRI